MQQSVILFPPFQYALIRATNVSCRCKTTAGNHELIIRGQWHGLELVSSRSLAVSYAIRGAYRTLACHVHAEWIIFVHKQSEHFYFFCLPLNGIQLCPSAWPIH